MNGVAIYEFVCEVISRCLGAPKQTKINSDKEEIEFNCPSFICSHDVNKYNLALNIKKGLYHCWKCGDKGTVLTLIKKYCKFSQTEYEEIQKYYRILNVNISEDPKDFIPLSFLRNYKCPLPPKTRMLDIDPLGKDKAILQYLVESRKISNKQLVKYKFLVSDHYFFKNKVIIPSFNQWGNINYFVLRTTDATEKIKYLNPSKKLLNTNQYIPKKKEIIFNEFFVDYHSLLFLTEGIFDAIRFRNAVPLLGKHLNIYLLKKIIYYKTPIVVALDNDAILESIPIFEKLKSINKQVYFLILEKYKDISELYEHEPRNFYNIIQKMIVNSVDPEYIIKHLTK